MDILVKLNPPLSERLQNSTFSSLGAAMLLTGYSSIEPVSSSGYTPKLLNFRQIKENVKDN